MPKKTNHTDQIEFNWGTYNATGMQRGWFPDISDALWADMQKIRSMIDAGEAPKPRTSGTMLVFRKDPAGGLTYLGNRRPDGTIVKSDKAALSRLHKTYQSKTKPAADKPESDAA
jgi:hypothetical protein